MAILKNKRILITGATGFIGANLVRHFLKKNADIFIFTRKTSDKWRLKEVLQSVSEYQVDLLDERKLAKTISAIKPNIIFHTAAYGGYPSQKDAGKIFEASFLGTVNLLNALKKIDFEAFVNTGSSSEYGIKNRAMKESDIIEPVSDYGVIKASITLFCKSLALRYKLPIATLRLFSPYGYYEQKTRLVPSVILACLKKRNPLLSSPRPVRDFVFIEDVMSAYEKAAENSGKIKAQIINIASGRQSSVKEIANKIIDLIVCKVKPQWGRVDNSRMEPTTWKADISKARELLGWQPDCDLSEGLGKTINWFSKNIRLYQ